MQESIRKKSAILWKWKSPFLSYAAGLKFTSCYWSDEEDAELDIGSDPDPLDLIVEVRLIEHPGLIVQARHIVAIQEGIEAKSLWRIFNLHSWLTWQLRYIVFYGSGRIWIIGHGKLESIACTPKAPKRRVEQPYLVAFETSLNLETKRTETFLPYWLGKSTLVDDIFTGEGIVIRQSHVGEFKRDPISRTFETLLSSAGKLIGL